MTMKLIYIRNFSFLKKSVFNYMLGTLINIVMLIVLKISGHFLKLSIAVIIHNFKWQKMYLILQEFQVFSVHLNKLPMTLRLTNYVDLGIYSSHTRNDIYKQV